jgi:conjugal transfer pilus assembly protein TraE
MSPDNAINERDSLKGQVRFLRSVVIGLIGLNVALLGLEAYTLMTAKEIVVPPEVRRPNEIGSNYANSDYLLDMAGYVLDKVKTVTPETVDYNNKVILKMAHPDGYGALKTMLDAAALRVKQDRVTTVWIPRNEKVNERAMTVEVSGQLKTFITDKLTSQLDKAYLVQFSVTTSGRLYVLKVEEVVKRDSAAKPAAAQP